MRVKSVLLVGVGGQGTIFVSKLLTRGLTASGYDVKMSEVHGMAQRGGSVSTQVRYGEKVFSPIIGVGQADVLVAFEKMEAVRYSAFLKRDGIAVINDYALPPIPVATGALAYPENCVEAMQMAFRTIVVDAAALAEKCGSPRTMNVALMGVLVKAFGMDDVDWESVLRDNIPANLLDVNIRALRAGMALERQNAWC